MKIVARDFADNQKVDYGDLSSLDAINNITLMADVFFDTVSDDNAIISKEQGSGQRTIFFFDDTGVTGNNLIGLFLDLDGGASFDRVDSDAAKIVGLTWYRVMGRWARNTTGGMYIKILTHSTGAIVKYMNQAPATTTDLSTNANTATVTVGETSAGTRDMDGRIATVIATAQVFSENLEDAMLRSPNPGALLATRAEIDSPLWGDRG